MRQANGQEVISKKNPNNLTNHLEKATDGENHSVIFKLMPINKGVFVVM